jgi:Fe-S cluster assembly protein SufD
MTEAAKAFIETFERERKTLPGAGLAWLDARRAVALETFAEAGLPHRRLEDWRYTDLARALDKASLAPAPSHRGGVTVPEARAGIAAFSAIDRHVVVFANGEMQTDPSDLTLPDGVRLLSLAEALSEPWAAAAIDDPDSKVQATKIVALNTALMRGGYGLHIAAGVKLDKPLHLVFIAADDGAFHSRALVRLEAGAEAVIYESHVDTGANAYFADLACDVLLSKGARLTRIKAQDEGSEGIHLETLRAGLATDAYLSNFEMTLGAALSRGQAFVRFDGEGGEAHVNGATALRGRQHGDQFCIVDHAVPHCTSATLFRTVLDDASTGVFQGKVVVQPHAQKTDGRQMTNALLLSRDAAMNAKPELEIYADDVQCAHGSTIGELNAEALFYLRSRGIDEQTARQLLISAFLDEAFETIPDEAARDGLRGIAADWFRLTRKEDA